MPNFPLLRTVVSFINPESGPANSSSHDGRLQCKFVVIADAERLYLVVGPIKEFPYHANLVERFCNGRGILTAWVGKPDLVDILDSTVRIKGGGLLKIDGNRKAINLGGVSRAYGRFLPEDLDGLLEADPFFAGYDISISTE